MSVATGSTRSTLRKRQQGCCDSAGARREDATLDEAGRLQLPESLGQHPCGDRADGFDVLGEPDCTAECGVEDRQLPSALEEVRRVADLPWHRPRLFLAVPVVEDRSGAAHQKPLAAEAAGTHLARVRVLDEVGLETRREHEHPYRRA